MGREILFRGKVTEDCRNEKLRGQWIEGSLIHQLWYYGSRVDRYHILYDGEFDCDYYMAEVVIPETVGQFTGLYDKDGKKIFEGDIVKGRFTTNNRMQTFKVCFDKGLFIFDNGMVKITIDRLIRSSVKVIGNIHDNPELKDYRKE